MIQYYIYCLLYFLFLFSGIIVAIPAEKNILPPDENIQSAGTTPAFVFLDGDWDFLPMDIEYNEVISGKYSDQWGTIPVPALWWEAELPKSSIVNWKSDYIDSDGVNKGPLYNNIQNAWYRYVFFVPSDFSTFQSRIKFSAVRWNCEIWLNGHRIGSHLGGFAPFEFELTSYLKFGEDNILYLNVGGWNSIPINDAGLPEITVGAIADWPNKSGGITGPVELRFYRRLAISSVFAIPYARNSAVQIQVTIKNSDKLKPGDLMELYLTEGLELVPINYTQSSIQKDPNTGLAGVDLFMRIPNAQFWSPDNPHLYKITAMIKDADGNPLDIQSENFGLRDFQIIDGNFYLNGERIQLRGANLRQEAALSIGSKATYDIEFAKKYLLDIARDANITVFRSHMGPMNRFWLNICDALGILVISEFPVSPFSNNWGDTTFGHFAIKEYQALLPYLWNHPSIIMWSISNKSWSDENRFVENNYIYPMIKQMDPTRPILRAGDISADMLDLHTYEGVEYKSIDNFRERIRKIEQIQTIKPVLCTEYLGTGSNEKGIWYDMERARLHLGDNPTVEQMQFKHAELAAQQTELLRFYQYDAILPYFYSDWVNLDTWIHNRDNPDYPKKKLTYYAIKNALAPVAVMLDITPGLYPSGKEFSFPIHIMNDTSNDIKIKLDYYLLSKNPKYKPENIKNLSKKKIYHQSTTMTVESFNKTSHPVKYKLPDKLNGTYYWVALITRIDNGEKVLSQRQIEISKDE